MEESEREKNQQQNTKLLPNVLKHYTYINREQQQFMCNVRIAIVCSRVFMLFMPIHLESERTIEKYVEAAK